MRNQHILKSFPIRKRVKVYKIKSEEKFSHTGKNLQILYEMFSCGRKLILIDVTNRHP